eukprot:CAMPEP_0173356824 /NCGR_PEP_ID=MMETSP1144-20121109/18537_1 /TAXON_ID=483371 /ORGANISM="non described non described, Strain CCMP2298" /LENGTH=351 /DNA_ID=CAMNT_0014305691 /DNA_START=188 /DNA_END=1240 /DNA_ORIENTATION=+
MKIKDDLYHADCFLCDSCKTPIRGKYVPIPIPAIPTPTIPIAGVAGVPGVPAVTGVGSRALHPQCAKRLDEAAAIAQGRVCARCSLPCVSVFLTVDSKCYHSACFLCTACQQPIEGRYTHKGDKAPYHPQCMNYGQSGKSGKSGSKSTIAPVSSGRSSSGGSSGGGGSNGIAQVCRGCAQPCTVGHFKSTPTALYHSSCFKCTACSSLIEDKYAEHGTPPNIYHVPCHRRLFSPRCCLCTSIMDGMYHRHPFFSSEMYCVGHEQRQSCFSCGRKEPLPTSSRGGFTDLLDGRKVCADCAPSMVVDSAQAALLYREVVRFMGTLGLPIPPGMLDVPVLLVDARSLNENRSKV